MPTSPDVCVCVCFKHHYIVFIAQKVDVLLGKHVTMIFFLKKPF